MSPLITVPLVEDMVPYGSPAPAIVSRLATPEKAAPPGTRGVIVGPDPSGGYFDLCLSTGRILLFRWDELDLVLNDPAGIGACLALRWLAERLGVPLPEVGCPGWERWGNEDEPLVYGLRSMGRMVFFRFGGSPLVGEHSPELTVIVCPALPDPGGPLADTRALALAVVTVAGGAS